MSTEILAPMPGTIIEVLVSSGEDVQEGQELLILEAMKMENPIVSPVDGKVGEVSVTVADKVATNQLMLIIE